MEWLVALVSAIFGGVTALVTVWIRYVLVGGKDRRDAHQQVIENYQELLARNQLAIDGVREDARLAREDWLKESERKRQDYMAEEAKNRAAFEAQLKLVTEAFTMTLREERAAHAKEMEHERASHVREIEALNKRAEDEAERSREESARNREVQEANLQCMRECRDAIVAANALRKV